MKTIIANWKMHLTVRESLALTRSVMLSLRGKATVPEVVLCPSFTALEAVHKATSKSRVKLGAQDVFWEEKGAFTGEISPRQLKELGVSLVIVGHSERRAPGGESDAMVNKKVIAVLAAGLTPIICVGETKTERQAGKAESVVRAQVKAALANLPLPLLKKEGPRTLIFAYEPVWAIGTGDPATPADAVAMHQLIRATAEAGVAGIKPKQIRVLYGGSVDGQNAYSFLREPEIDGLLVGGASLKTAEFEQILSSTLAVISNQ